ncbi:hypothetical protein ACHQM5_006792 [Ranunculus cassubicifolius]
MARPVSLSSKKTNKVKLFEPLMKNKDKLTPTWIGRWTARDLLYITVLVLVHGLCLFAPFTFSWDAFWVAVVHYLISGLLGITLCYHRCLSHSSFKLPKPLEYLFAYFGLQALQAHPLFWVSTHRYHHKGTDTVKDPHSPIEGFWHSHISWSLDENYLARKGEKYVNVVDLRKQGYYRFLEKTLVLHVLLLMGSLYAWGGFPYLVWGMGVANCWGYHVTFLVNSVCHTWGHQAWNTKDLSKNNWLVAMVTFGEGWHNNHHAFEYSARQGLEWWQIDMTWWVIKVLEHLGLATNVKIPTEIQKEKMSFKKNDEEYMKLVLE